MNLAITSFSNQFKERGMAKEESTIADLIQLHSKKSNIEIRKNLKGKVGQERFLTILKQEWCKQLIG